MTTHQSVADRHVEIRPPEILSKERRPPVPKEQRPRPDVDASWLSMKLILNESQHMFNCRQTLTEEADNSYSDVLRDIFRKTQKEHETRQWLGTSSDLWQDFAGCLEEVVVQIQDLFSLPRTNHSDEETFTSLVINNAARAFRDFQRTNELVLVARNMLVGSSDAQRYAVETTCHHEVLNMVQICIEFNSEGFAGEAGSVHETTFNRVVNAAKTLLVTCLQFLFNLLKAGSELRTSIWLELLCLDTDFRPNGPPIEQIDPSDPIEKPGDDNEFEIDAFDYAAQQILGHFATPLSGKNLRELLADFRNNSGIQLNLDKLFHIGLVTGKSDIREELEALSIPEARGRIRAAKRALFAPLEADFYLPEDDSAVNPGTEEDFLRFRKSFYPTEQDFTYQRGLPASPYNLSEIPIILAPSGEIEALPMFILVCIFEKGDLSDLSEKERLEQAIRCLFLVRSTTGRMLLRELFIFIAAWDLPEDELFFRSMVNITSSLHQHNLLYEAYKALADPKDIVSPGQNVLVKLALHKFKSISDPPELYDQRSNVLKALDIKLVRFLVSTFRQHILPRALAIIWLQGQFRDDVAAPEGFERANLNLWDMERTYEGVYQYLEFFSALNDNMFWKDQCIKLEIAWDIVELIRYLHKYIPIQPFIIPPPLQHGGPSRTSSESRAGPHRTSSIGGRGSSLERPYSPAISNRSAPSHTGGAGSISSNGQRPSSVQAQADSSPPPSTSEPTTPQPPHTYPWRNLKKMSILVLSGLLYNTPSLRSKMRSYDGVLLIASCSEHDENNPYIKEHAVLCLKLLLEGDRENQRLVEELRAREVRSAPELEAMGYRADIDEAGRVRVWQKREGEFGRKEEVLLPTVLPGEISVSGGGGAANANGDVETIRNVNRGSEISPGMVPHASGVRLVEVFDDDDDDEDDVGDDGEEDTDNEIEVVPVADMSRPPGMDQQGIGQGGGQTVTLPHRSRQDMAG